MDFSRQGCRQMVHEISRPVIGYALSFLKSDSLSDKDIEEALIDSASPMRALNGSSKS